MDIKEKEKIVKIIFAIRACLWAVALGATIYWIVWSFKIYAMGIHDVYEYAGILRPKFYGGIIVAVIAICISFWFRHLSDTVKKM